MGVITSRSILNLRTSNVLKKDSEIRRAVNKDFKCVKHSDPMKYLSKSFNRHTHILVHNSEKSEYSVIEHKDYLNYFMKNKMSESSDPIKAETVTEKDEEFIAKRKRIQAIIENAKKEEAKKQEAGCPYKKEDVCPVKKEEVSVCPTRYLTNYLKYFFGTMSFGMIMFFAYRKYQKN